MQLDETRCDCGSAELVAVAPGDEPLRLVDGGLPITQGERLRGFCEACWRKSWRVAA